MKDDDSKPAAEEEPDVVKPQVDAATLDVLLQHAPGFISFIGPDRLTKYLNRTSYGFTMNDVIDKPYTVFLTPEQTLKYEKTFERSTATGESDGFEYFFDTPDRGRQWAYANTSAVFNDNGELLGYINIITEITAQKRAEEQLKKTQAELVEASHRAGMAEVATGVLHNVGNVLNSVNVSASTLKEQLDSSHIGLLERTINLMEEQGDDLPGFIADDPKGQKIPLLLSRLKDQLVSEKQIMHVELQRLMEHINIIRSTIEAQQSIAKSGEVLEHVMIADVIDRALSMFRIDLENKNIALDRQVDDPPPVILDKQGTLQILANLVRNAIEALAGVDNPKLMVRARADKDRIFIEIADNGCGIEEENLTKIFRHGFTTKQSGHGFGLHASAIAAQAMGGSLNVTSEGEGQGASFCLTIPRRDAPPE